MTQDSGKDQAAKRVAELRVTFDLALADKRKYPVQEFKAFVHGVQRYIEMTQQDPMVHKSVVRAVNGLREFLEVERKRVPGGILFEADRLECQFFEGYDLSSKATNLRDCERRRFSETFHNAGLSAVEAAARFESKTNRCIVDACEGPSLKTDCHMERLRTWDASTPIYGDR